MTRILRALTMLIGAAAWLAISATTAFAGDAYPTGGGGVKGESAGTGGGTLPFTGSDLAVYVVIAAAIVVSGLALHAYSERRVDRS